MQTPERQREYKKGRTKKAKRLDLYLPLNDAELLQAQAQAQGLRLGPYLIRLLSEMATSGNKSASGKP